jgi:hypothetical protein
MDGLSRSIGDGISGLVGGAIHAIGAALDGMVSALGSALPAGALPVIGIATALLLAWAVLKR